MPSRTPETLTAVQRAQRLNLPRNDKKGEAEPTPIQPPMSQTKPPSKQVQQAMDKGRATLLPISANRSATARIDPRDDPDLSFMVLPIDEIEPYKNNPRTGANPNYEQIKASIKADGITNMLTVTRRDKHGKYTTYGGGNTRLRVAKELYAEGDQRFANLRVVFKEWPGDAQVITAHLVENENRADITFWEKAQGVQMFRTEFERENDKPLTAGELNRELKQRGLNYGIKTLQNFAFAHEQLAPIGPWLKSTAVNEVLRPRLTQLHEVGAKLAQGKAVQQSLQGVLSTTAEALHKAIANNEDLDPEDRQPVELDDAQLVSDMEQATADVLGVDVPTMTAMLAALATDPRITSERLRAVRAEPSGLAASAPHFPIPAATAPATSEGHESAAIAISAELQAAPVTASGVAAADTLAPAPAPAPELPPAEQTPLPGMLAGVPASKAPRMPAVQPQQPVKPIDTRQAILDTLGTLNCKELPLHDVLVASPQAPFGFFVDFPPQDLAHVDGQPIDPNTVELRSAAWRVLAAISGQCDHRFARVFVHDRTTHWGQLLAQGPQAFAAACLERTGVRFHAGEFHWQMSDLARVLSDSCAYSFIRLMAHMEQVRLDEQDNEVLNSRYMPLFSEDLGHG